ncbi:MAG TPA: hypothetical protein VF240_06580 [Pyrinomonadaceae bacterium]
MKAKGYRGILWGGLAAGVLDLAAALVTSSLRGVTPTRVLQAIASGVLGADSYRGGAQSATLGVALHFVIAFGAAAVYYAASRRLKCLVRRPVVSGLLYGVAVYLFMNLVVLPLSAITFKVSYAPAVLATGLVVHMLCVGLPIALAVRRFSK